MFLPTINACTVGSWVWRLPSSRGRILSEVRNSMFGDPLKHVQWDDGTTETLYPNCLFSTGPISSLEDFGAAIQAGAEPYLTLGSQGGFREFTMQVRFQEVEYTFRLFKDGRAFFVQVVIDALVTSKAKIRVTTLADARSKSGRDSTKTLTARKVAEWFA